MTPITKTTDLLYGCKPIYLQIKEHSIEPVKNKVAGFLVKCSTQLGLSFDPSFIQILAEDLIEKYKHDSIEDIAECLKKGRQGYYGTSYNKLTMIVITDWMHKFLSEKENERVKHLKQKYQTTKEPLKVVDYEAFKARIAEKKPKIAKGQKEMLDEYIEKVCQAMEIDTKELFAGSRKKEVADVRGLIKTYQSEVLRMTREQIKEYWKSK
jgi:hypothetical protein